MKHWLTMVLLVVTVAACGCAQKVPEPTMQDMKDMLNGAALTAGDQEYMVSTVDVSNMQVQDFAVGPEGKTGSAAVTFNLVIGDEGFAVDGVLSYTISEGGEFERAMFEANEITPVL